MQSFELDNSRYRDSRGMIAQWQHNLDERRQLTGYLQYAQLRYPSQEIRDANRGIGGAAYAQAFSGRLSPVLFLSAYGGREKELADGVPHLGHEPAGIRIGGQFKPAEGWTVFGGSITRSGATAAPSRSSSPPARTSRPTSGSARAT